MTRIKKSDSKKKEAWQTIKNDGLLDIEVAEKYLHSGDKNEAWKAYKQAADRFTLILRKDKDADTFFISVVLQLSNLSFVLGKGFANIVQYLHKAHEIAKTLGNRRSHAILNMHLGRLYYFSDMRNDAMVALSVGLNEIEDLGDEDILDQSAEFLGMFYFMQGLFKEALGHLERAERVLANEEGGLLRNPMTPMLLGYTLAYLGEFHRAIGSLDFYRRMAKERSDHNMAMILKIILGTILISMNREKEGYFYIEEILNDAQLKNNFLAQFLVSGAITFKHLSTGQAEKAYNIFKKGFETAGKAGFIRQYTSPWVLEVIYEFEDLGFKLFPGMTLNEAMERAIRENNVHLHGVSLRLKALQKLAENTPIKTVLNDLSLSEKLLEKSGDIIQLSKTKVEIARLELSRGHRKIAKQKAKEAWHVMGGYAEQFFPDNLHYLVDSGTYLRKSTDAADETFDRYIELTEAMFPVDNQKDVLSRAIKATNRFFGAERGGLFWFPNGDFTNQPILRAFFNLSQKDITAEEFKSSYNLILKCFMERQPLMKRKALRKNELSGRELRSILCLPVEVGGKVRAVIYHDNSYLEDCFDFLNDKTIKKVIDHVSRQSARIYEYYKIVEERNELVTAKNLQDASLEEKVLIYKSRLMADLVDRIDRVSQTDSTILLLGETGVGKEVVARRVHAESPRRERPFVIVDATTIPENLFESELFGHEKGAFTGADHQKKGRLELADRGTLFIDEIGELPLSVQVKLLRTIQERTFLRLGGTRTITSDFRLIAATNRDLTEEIAAKRFRADLYYRLNVIPFEVPALRDRPEDIVLLANHFLGRLAKKYHRPDLEIDSKTENFLRQYHWPGNVRELENIIERAVLLSTKGELEIDLPLNNTKKPLTFFDGAPTLDEMDRRYISYVLEQTGGKIGGPGGAVETLGIKRTTLISRMKKLGLR